MKVRIGIITRNRAALLPKALDSALAQDFPDKEIIVYDIASSDETPSLREKYPQVQWLRSDERLEMIGPKNRLMSQTDADFYFSLDDDAWFLSPDELSRGVELMRANLKLAVLAYDILLPGMSPQKLAAEPVKHHQFVACGALLRRSALEKAGYYRKLPAAYGGTEETDLCLKLLDRGYEIMTWRGLHIWHERTAVGRDRADQHRSLVCNEFCGLMMNCPLVMLPVLFPWRLASHFLAAIRNRELKSYRQGLVLFAKNFNRAMAARSPVSMKAYREYFKRARGDKSQG
jgi:GT2 family glycosyltransferase